jgi:hypothetical protein
MRMAGADQGPDHDKPTTHADPTDRPHLAHSNHSNSTNAPSNQVGKNREIVKFVEKAED